MPPPASLLPVALTLLIAGTECRAALEQGPDGNLYEVVLHPDRALSWDEALAEAAATGDTLAAIRGEATELFVEDLRREALIGAGLDPDAPTAPALWVGGSQSAGAGTPRAGWSWVGGDPISGGAGDPGYSHWLPGEPDDQPTAVEDGGEGHLALGAGGRFGWSDRGAPCYGYVKMREVEHRETSHGPYPFSDGETLYQFILSTRRFSYEEAVEDAACQSYLGLPGRLAVIDTPEKAEFVESLRAAAVATQGYSRSEPESHPPLWIGGRQSSSAGAPWLGWAWSDGSGIDSGFSDWAAGQPDDGEGGIEDNEENGLATGRAGGAWSDEPAGSRLLGYIVEFRESTERRMHLRSTEYRGDGGFRYGHRPGYTRNVAMTVEAWVLRRDSARFETIVSQGYRDSFWFGFAGDRLRFYRSGGAHVDSTVGVPVGQWTHVAASYDGAAVRFYVDGAPAGHQPLAHSGTGTAGEVSLGLDLTSELAPFALLGNLDEVRLWSTARSQAEIVASRFVELDAGPGLEAAWPRGGQEDVVTENWATGVGSYQRAQRIGILPTDLIVPAAAADPTFDGNVDPVEYAGAEQVVLRYSDGPNFLDATGYIIHTKDYLYLGIEGARLPADGSPPSAGNALVAMLDGDGSTAHFNDDLHRAAVFQGDGSTAYSRVRTRAIENPFGGSPLSVTAWGAETPPAREVGMRRGVQIRDELSSGRDVEFRFHREKIGSGFGFESLHRLALAHLDHGGPSADDRFPDGAGTDVPGTWAEVRYSPESDPLLPKVRAGGTVEDPGTGGAIPGVEIQLRVTGATVATATTDSRGQFSFDVDRVPRGARFEILVTPPVASIPEPATFSGGGVEPLSLSTTNAVWAGCDSGTCRTANLTFRFRLPPPPATLGGFSPAEASAPVLVRGGVAPKSTAGTTLRVEGDHLHGRLDFYFARPSCPVHLAAADCIEGVDYFPASATLVEEEGGPPYVLLETPGVAPSLYGPMRIIAHDRWARPGNSPSESSSWQAAAEPVTVTAPPYERIHGFEFANVRDGHDIDDYRAAFYDQACDPRYLVGFWAFSPVYLSVFGGGECVGITATAGQFARGRRNPASIDREVLFGKGFRTAPDPDPDAVYDIPVMPATFDVMNPCSPRPTNVMAAIRANHGVQASSEFIGVFLEQLSFDYHYDMVDIAAQLDRIRGRELEFMLCLSNGDQGHCVQPLRVIDTADPNLKHIEIWDNNFPDQRRVIDIDLHGSDTYTYDGGFSDGVWVGNWLHVYEVDRIYDHQRHVPSVDIVGYALAEFGVTHLSDLLQLLVSGEAEPLATAGDGGQTGWDAAGEFVNTGREAVPIPHFNAIPGEVPPMGHHPVSIHHRTHLGAPAVELHNRGTDYTVHQSHHGTMFQAFVSDGVDGTSDRLKYKEDAGRVLGVTFTAGVGGREVRQRIALCKRAREYPAAIGIGPMRVPEGASVGIETFADGNGFALHNDSGLDAAPSFEIVLPGAGGPEPRILDTPAHGIPDGSTLTVRSPDGSSFARLRFDLDLDRDGSPERTLQFDPERAEFGPLQPASRPEPRLFANPEGDGQLILAYAEGHPDWQIESSADLADWRALDLEAIRREVVDGEIHLFLPIRRERMFYRFAAIGE